MVLCCVANFCNRSDRRVSFSGLPSAESHGKWSVALVFRTRPESAAIISYQVVFFESRFTASGLHRYCVWMHRPLIPTLWPMTHGVIICSVKENLRIYNDLTLLAERLKAEATHILFRIGVREKLVSIKVDKTALNFICHNKIVLKSPNFYTF